jgi:hypothetical protein
MLTASTTVLKAIATANLSMVRSMNAPRDWDSSPAAGGSTWSLPLTVLQGRPRSSSSLRATVDPTAADAL